MDSTQNGNPRQAAQPIYLPKDEGLITFPLAKTALLVIDPVNDFLSEGGACWEMTKATVKLHDVIDNLKRVIEGARAHGIPVLFGPMAYTEEDYGHARLHRRSGINRLMFENKMFLAGSWGADFHPDLKPREDEIVLLPHKGIDVFETDLPAHLERLGITHLVIAGMTANLCCESTGRQAMERGFDVTYLADAIGAESVVAYEAAVRVNYPLIANAVLKVDEFLAALESSLPDSTLTVGDTVYGSDRGEIGTVEEVAPGDPGRPGYLLVRKGVLFEKDFYIPLDAVVKRTAHKEVFINLPKLVIKAMPWDVPPSLKAQQEKHGPKDAGVSKLYSSRDATLRGASGNQP